MNNRPRWDLAGLEKLILVLDGIWWDFGRRDRDFKSDSFSRWDLRAPELNIYNYWDSRGRDPTKQDPTGQERRALFAKSLRGKGGEQYFGASSHAILKFKELS